MHANETGSDQWEFRLGDGESQWMAVGDSHRGNVRDILNHFSACLSGAKVRLPAKEKFGPFFCEDRSFAVKNENWSAIAGMAIRLFAIDGFIIDHK